MRNALALLLAAGGLSLSACAGAQAVGTTPAYAGGAYAGAPYFNQSACWANGWAGTFDYPYCGWYNGFFYPGSGAFMYDRNRQRHALTPEQQNHWAAQNPTLSNGMHSPGPVRIPGAFGAHAGAGMGGPRGGARGFGGGHGFGGGRGTGGGHGFGGGHGTGGGHGFGGGHGTGGGHGSGAGHSGR